MSSFDPVSSRSRATKEMDILGERLVIRSSEDPDFVNEVAELVKLRLQEANRRLAGTPNKNRVLLLALLDLAEEYVKSKKRFLNQRAKVNARMADARRALDRAEGKYRATSSDN